jgi:hypothetical protein
MTRHPAVPSGTTFALETNLTYNRIQARWTRKYGSAQEDFMPRVKKTAAIIAFIILHDAVVYAT